MQSFSWCLKFSLISSANENVTVRVFGLGRLPLQHKHSFQQMRFPCKTLNVDFSPIFSAMNHYVPGNMQMLNILGVCVFYVVVSRYRFPNAVTSLRGRVVLDYVHNPENCILQSQKIVAKWLGWVKKKTKSRGVCVCREILFAVSRSVKMYSRLCSVRQLKASFALIYVLHELQQSFFCIAVCSFWHMCEYAFSSFSDPLFQLHHFSADFLFCLFCDNCFQLY